MVLKGLQGEGDLLRSCLSRASSASGQHDFMDEASNGAMVFGDQTGHVSAMGEL